MGERTMRGVGVSPGTALAPARVAAPPPIGEESSPGGGNAADEQARLERALEAARAEVAGLVADLRAAGQAEVAGILEVHDLLLDDPFLRDAIAARMAAGDQAHEAVRAAAEEGAALLDALDDASLRDRAADVRDVAALLLRYLAPRRTDERAGAEPGVLVAADLAPSEAAALATRGIVGVALERGGPTSHAAIIARALGVPLVVGLGPGIMTAPNGALVALDGTTGEVVVEPAEDTQARYRARVADNEHRAEASETVAPAQTTDGRRVALTANVGGADGMAAAAQWGAEGVGLLRSEFLFLDRSEPPSEEEQVQVYRQVVAAAGGRPVVLRMLDAGGDKYLPYLPLPRAENPALSVRGVRVAPWHPDVMRTQVRAALRAAYGARLRLLLPMVTTVDEVRRVRALLDEAARALDEAGMPHEASLPLGVMVETPAAALTAAVLAREVDFFSIGTNDLTAYTLACDRADAAVAALYQPAHPAVLRLIGLAIGAARAAGRHVAVCGEMAGDPALAPLLVGLGVDELSMAPVRLPAVRAAIRARAHADLVRLAQRACTLATAEEVLAAIAEHAPPT